MGKPRVRGATHGSMARRIEHHHQVRGRHDLPGAMERDSLRAREAQGLLRELLDVGVLRDGPERLEAIRGEVRDRRFRA